MQATCSVFAIFSATWKKCLGEKEKHPSNIRRKKFERIGPLLEQAQRKTKPRPLTNTGYSVLYLLRTGCLWRALPHVFPK